MYRLPVEKSLKSWISWSPEYSDHLVDQNSVVPNQWTRKKLVTELFTLEDQANPDSGQAVYAKAIELVKNLMIQLPDIFDLLVRELEFLNKRIEQEKTVMTSREYKKAVQDAKAYKNVIGKIQLYTSEGLN